MTPLRIKSMSEDEWGELDYIACQTFITVSGLFAYTGEVNDKGENDHQMRNKNQINGIIWFGLIHFTSVSAR